jgi:predicted ATPase/DNA-binding SARP family transcriptional activator
VAVSVKILGPTEVRVDGRRVPVASLRQRTVLAALAASAGSPVSVDHLVEQLWPERPPSDAPANLQVHISRLRAALRNAGAGEAIVTEPPGYALVGAEVDAAEFEALADAGRAALEAGDAAEAARLLHRGLGLWRADVLGDLDAPFAGPLAARLDERRVAALEDRIDADLALGRHLHLTAELPALIDVHPYRERLRGEYMLALYRCGRQADALDAFQAARRCLVEELGLEPGTDLRRLEEAILLQKPELDWHPPASASGGSDIVGRDAVIDAVEDALTDPGVVTLVGPGGVGKTRTATAIASSHPGPTPCFVGLDDRAESVLDAIAAACGASQRQQQTQLDAVASALRDHGDGLLVVDNCEHLLLAVADTVAALQEAVPTLRVLATSRQPLGLSNERVIDVPPLDEDSATELFARRAADIAPGFALTTENAATVLAICRLVNHLPLAIELAAARAAAMNVESLLTRLAEPLHWLRDDDARDRPERHRSLRDCIAWSYGLLEPDEQRVFRSVSVFAGDFDVTDAEAIVGDADTTVADALARLARASLLTVDTTPRTVRFSAAEAVRQFGSEQLRAAGEDAACRERQLVWLDEAVRRFTTGPVPDVAGLNALQGQIWAALDWALGNPEHQSTGLALATSLSQWWTLRGALTEGRRWLERALANGGAASDVARGHLAAGSLAYAAGDLGAAASHFESARDAEGADEKVRLRARFSLANVAHVSGVDVVGEMRAIADEATDDDDLRLRVLNSLAVVARRAGDMDGAIVAGEDALRIARRLGNDIAVATILVTLGGLAAARQQLDLGRERLDEALALGRKLGAHTIEAAALGTLATIEPEPDRAVRLLEESLDATRVAGDQPATVVTLLNLAAARERAGDVGGARRSFEEVRALAEQMGDPRGVAQACLELARLGRRTGAPWGQSAALAAEALELRHAAGDVERTAEVLEVAGGLALDAGDREHAAVLLSAGDRLRAATAGARDPLDSAEWEADLAELGTPLPDAGALSPGAAVALAREVLQLQR